MAYGFNGTDTEQVGDKMAGSSSQVRVAGKMAHISSGRYCQVSEGKLQMACNLKGFQDYHLVQINSRILRV